MSKARKNTFGQMPKTPIHDSPTEDREDLLAARKARKERGGVPLEKVKARLKKSAKAAVLPPLPEPDAEGSVPAVQFARATIARGIIRDRMAAGLNQKELAHLAGVRVETLCRIETGKHTPSVETVRSIDRALRRAAGRNKRGKAQRPPRGRRRDETSRALKARKEAGGVPLEKVKARLGMK